MPIRSRNVDLPAGAAAGLGILLPQFIFNAGAVSGNEAAIVAAAQPNVTAGGTTTLTVAASPDVPRTLNFGVSTDSDADLTVNFTAWGTDQFGEAVTETSGDVTLAGGVVESNFAYRVVSRIDVKTLTASNVDSADRVRVGYGPSLALYYKIASSADVLRVLEGELDLVSGATGNALEAMTLVTSAPSTGEYSLDTVYHTFKPGTVPDGVLDYFLEIRSTYNRISQT
jgi:hypothetical protein